MNNLAVITSYLLLDLGPIKIPITILYDVSSELNGYVRR